MAKLLIPLEEIPTIAHLYVVGRLEPSSSATTNTPSQTYNNKVAYIRNDITSFAVDAIVNAAKSTLLGGGGVDYKIHKAAGPGLLKECRTLNGCETGSAKITDAYKLPCKKVIHAVGPRYKDYEKAKARELLRGCYRTCLQLAVDNGLRSIAFPCLSAGIFGYPTEEAAETALEEVRKFLESGKGDSLGAVVFCVWAVEDEAAYNTLIPIIFPPTEEDLLTEDEERQQQQPQEARESALLANMPAPPSFDPAEQGQPNAKKVKVAHAGTDDDWVEIVKPDSATKEDEEMVRATGVEAQNDREDWDNVVTASDHSSETNRLSKDW